MIALPRDDEAVATTVLVLVFTTAEIELEAVPILEFVFALMTAASELDAVVN